MLLTEGSEGVAGGRAIRLPGLPDFNAGDEAFKINSFEGWFDGPRPVPVLVANGGAPGAVAVGDWDPAERFYTLVGRIDAPGGVRTELRRMLLAAFPPGQEVSIGALGNEVDADLQVFVQLYDVPALPPGESVLRFSFPLVAPDPYKYGLTALTAECGAFAPIDWYRIYSEDAGDWYRTYTEDGATNYRTYEQEEEDTSSLPGSAVLVSEGDVASRRLTITVTGPLGAGDWWLEDANGTRLWAEVGLLDGQSVVFDCLNRTATLAGANIDHLVQGDFLAMEPGTNTYRLLVGTSTGGFATFEGLEAYR